MKMKLQHMKILLTVVTIFCPVLTGGVGWAATQLAKTVPGVTVFGTASQYKHQAIKKNGVDFPISYDQVRQLIKDNTAMGETAKGTSR